MSALNFFQKLFSKQSLATKNYPNFFAVRVLKIEKHPNADRLRLVEASLGGRSVWPIVCGAFNFQVGDIVALALPGALIAQDIHSKEHQSFVLQKAVIRGIESQGMICAAFELGLSNEPGQGILVLKSGIMPGSEFKTEMIS